MILLTLIFGGIALWACLRVELLTREVKRERALDAEATQILCEHICDLTDEVRFLGVEKQLAIEMGCPWPVQRLKSAESN